MLGSILWNTVNYIQALKKKQALCIDSNALQIIFSEDVKHEDCDI